MMNGCVFEKIIVIGYGRVTGEVIAHIHLLQDRYGYKIEHIIYEVHDFNQAIKYCRENNIPCETIEDKHALTERFKDITEKTLIVSASNNYLFPVSVVEKKNLTIINFHNALLPDLPGRNAPSWAIYEGRKKTGITWHYVNADVDAGDIIIRKECEIPENEKAYELADKLMNLATDAFKECFKDVILEKVTAIKQGISPNRHIYRSCELPGKGFFISSDDPERISRILRSMDYGKSGVFPPVKMIMDDKEVRVVRYRIITGEVPSSKENTVFIPMNDDRILQIKYSLD